MESLGSPFWKHDFQAVRGYTIYSNSKRIPMYAEMEKNMNFFNRKNQKIFAGAICVIVILAMVIPIVLGAM